MIYNGNGYIYEKNVQGDVIGVFNSSRVKVATYEYDAWGNILSKTGTMADVNPFRYRSYYQDNETGFYYLNTRYYDPEVRRFINADNYELLPQLSSIVGQLNMYSYCNNNPVMFTDPNGEFILGLIGGIIFTTLLSGAITGSLAGLSALATGQDAKAAFIGGFINGAINGLALSLGIATGGFGGLAIAGIGGFGGGYLGQVVKGGISTGHYNWRESDAFVYGAFSAGINMLAYGGTALMLDSIGESPAGNFMQRLYQSFTPSFHGLYSTLFIGGSLALVEAIATVISFYIVGNSYGQ